MAGFSRPSPPQPRYSRPHGRGVCLPTQCLVSPLSTLYPWRSPLWRCSSSAFGMDSSASALMIKRIATASHRQQFTYQAVQGSSLRGWSSYDHRGPSSVLMDFGPPRGRGRSKRVHVSLCRACIFYVLFITHTRYVVPGTHIRRTYSVCELHLPQTRRVVF